MYQMGMFVTFKLICYFFFHHPYQIIVKIDVKLIMVLEIFKNFNCLFQEILFL